MLLVEYRIVMPLKVDEYRIGQIYSTLRASKKESGGGDGIEIVEYRDFNNISLLDGKYNAGQYTYKIYHLENKAPALLRLIVPKAGLKLHEESYNAFPYCKTTLTNPGFMKENFVLRIESLHLAGNTNEFNALSLPPNELQNREVVLIDIASPLLDKNDYRESEDPSLFTSKKTMRGPLQPKIWVESGVPLMTCYKLVMIECKWFGLQKRIEKILQRCEHRLFTVFNRQVFCWIDDWYDLTLLAVRDLERAQIQEINKKRLQGEVQGLLGDNLSTGSGQ